MATHVSHDHQVQKYLQQENGLHGKKTGYRAEKVTTAFYWYYPISQTYLILWVSNHRLYKRVVDFDPKNPSQTLVKHPYLGPGLVPSVAACFRKMGHICNLKGVAPWWKVPARKTTFWVEEKSEPKWKHPSNPTVDGSEIPNNQPPGMYKTPANNVISYLSTSAGFPQYHTLSFRKSDIQTICLRHGQFIRMSYHLQYPS